MQQQGGKGDEKNRFRDVSGHEGVITRNVTANIYISWFSPTGPAEFVSNMRNLKKGISVLYVAGSRSHILFNKKRENAFDYAPSNPNNQFTIIDATHMEVPKKSSEVIIEWLHRQ